MDHDKLQMTSKAEEKGDSSASDNNATGLISEEECAGSNSEGNHVPQVLQPFFVADTLEEDESIIAPSQDDSELLIPSTPAYDSKSEKRSESVEANESTVSMLEETCVFEKKAQLNDSSGENAISVACHESDMTQDLDDLEPTEPIIPSNVRVEHSFVAESNNADKNKTEEEDDDEWQLKFSETQTQEILGNFQKDDQSDEEAETQKIIPRKNDELLDDDDLPPTQSIEVPQRDADEDSYKKDEDPEIKDNLEVLETQSDDEIEPSQSCLSEYKGETISALFKIQPNIEISNEEIPEHSAEKETKNDNDENDMDITMIYESEKRTTTFSESQPKNIFNDTEDNEDVKILSVQEKSAKNDENCEKVDEKEQSVFDVDEAKNPDFESRAVKENSVECSVSKESVPKIYDERSPKMTETNGNQIDEIEISDDEINAEVDNEKFKSSKVVEKTLTKPKVVEPGANDFVINLEEHNTEMKEENNKFDKEKSNSIEIIENEVGKNVEAMEIDEKKEQNMSAIYEAVKAETNEIICMSEEVESSKQELKTEVLKSKPQQQSDMQPSTDITKTADSEALKSQEIVLDSEPSKISSENLLTSQHTPDEKTETPLKPFLKPAPKQSVGSLKKHKAQSHEVSCEKSDKKIAFKDIESLDNFFKSIGVKVEHEKLESLISKPNEDQEFKVVYKIKNFEIILKEASFITETDRRDSYASPLGTSGSTTATLGTSSTLPSGEIADISSSSADIFPKTSTQKSPKKSKLLENFEEKGLGEKSKTDVSPILPEKSPKGSASKRKRGGKKNAASSSTSTSSTIEPKSKRAKGKGKSKAKTVINKTDETEESNDAIPEEKPKKPTRRKKDTTTMPDVKLMPDIRTIKAVIENTETTTEDDSSFQEDTNFGTIIPGCKVMARWKDGYYYSGMVQSQELDGRWNVFFDDGFSRTISPECLIKIAILPKATSVLVRTPDDFFDPGIICGHFREGNKVGYEVQRDSGDTRRYKRSDVILSSDQAKLIMKNAPPTTPPTMTINLDNIVGGKRKRKSVQSPVVTTPVKKSSRVTRSKKPDSNLDSTEDFSDSDIVPDKNINKTPDNSTKSIISKIAKISETSNSMSSVKSKDSGICSEEPPIKMKRTKTGAKSTAAVPLITNEACSAVSMPSTSSSKVTKVLPQRAAKKLFKDYAFLLTNTDRKTLPKPADSSDSEQYVAKSEEDIVPFDFDELCNNITSGGGKVLAKFDDTKKCRRKYIYLLANSYLRTMKYIQSIAAGISCIKHHWIQNCIYKSEILSIKGYILPAGYSIVTQQVVEWHGKTDIFKDCRIALVSAPEAPFVTTWAPVLLAAKASFVQKWNLPTSAPGCSLVVDVLITNKQCPTDIIQSAKKRKIPIVSSEWIIQCLIMGERLPYDAHPKFKYDYTE